MGQQRKMRQSRQINRRKMKKLCQGEREMVSGRGWSTMSNDPRQSE